MISQDFLYYSLGIGFLIAVGFLSYTAITLSSTLKRLTSILIKIDGIIKDVEDFKNFIKTGALYLKNILQKKEVRKNDKQKKD